MYRDMARRSQVASIFVAAKALRDEVSARAEAKKSMIGAGAGLTVVPSGALTRGEVSADGIIVLRGLVDGYLVEVVFKPKLSAGKVQWSCGALKEIEGWFVPNHAYFPKTCPKVASVKALCPSSRV